MIHWAIHAAHWAALYGAFVANNPGALAVLKFWVWVLLPLSAGLQSDEAVAEYAGQPVRRVRDAAFFAQSWATLGLLVWFGHPFTGAALVFVMLMVGLLRHRAAQSLTTPGDTP